LVSKNNRRHREVPPFVPFQWFEFMPRRVLHRDCETKSTLDLRDVGAWRYATHTTTDVWCYAYAVDDGPINIWKPGDPVPPEIITTADENSDWSAAAFNDGFERLIEQHILAPRYGWPVVPIQQHRCLQAAALALALPARLESVAKALSLTQQKDAEGHKLMMQMARPRRPRRGEDPNGIYWFGDPERIRRLHEYCRQDVNVERELFYPRRLPQCG
jgi:DNA polymerase bacteriophage-type